ncbi:hypothetical protein JFL43_08890 [Viridibacillus sp. YIM B01967]|uniref:Uncharacterized protein n=1 Tax=Viridibacillus soli TaxID=2798301 RepID=A0ABS1H6D7_9BACL|nr:hypothetical protein [Viridibacillus soli]MBK3494975.1 hypothetical protein [Viridibacillus soli]
MKDFNTAVFFIILGISLLAFSIIAPIHSPAVRAVLLLLGINFCYRSIHAFSIIESKKRSTLNSTAYDE